MTIGHTPELPLAIVQGSPELIEELLSSTGENLADNAPWNNLRQLLASQHIRADDVWIARLGETLVGAMLFQRRPDATAWVSLPLLNTQASRTPGIALQMLQSAAAEGDRTGIRCSYFTTGLAEHADEAMFREAGFSLIAELGFLACELEPATSCVFPGELVPVPVDVAHKSRLQSLLLKTYQGTADCPAVTSRRTAAESWERHLGRAAPPDRLWTVFQANGSDVAALLLVRDEPATNWEVDYFGVIPAHRGKGWGTALLNWGKEAARRAGGGRLLATVDSANSYAVKCYSATGFSVRERRNAWLRARQEPAPLRD